MAELKCAQCHYYYIVFLISDHYTILSSMFENYDNSCLKSITLLRVSYSKVKLDWPTKRGMEAHTLPIQDKNGFQLPKTSIENYICLGYRIFQTFLNFRLFWKTLTPPPLRSIPDIFEFENILMAENPPGLTS